MNTLITTLESKQVADLAMEEQVYNTDSLVQAIDSLDNRLSDITFDTARADVPYLYEQLSCIVSRFGGMNSK